MAILSASEISPNLTTDFDICIVGSGIAGLILAIELEKSNAKVLILEAGEIHINKKSQARYSGAISTNTYHPSASSYRYRVAGGSSKKWAGRCVEFDKEDFDKVNSNGYKVWPLTYDDVCQYYNQARKSLDADIEINKLDECFDQSVPNLFVNFDLNGYDKSSFELYSKPTDVFTKYRSFISNSKNILMLTDMNVKSIQSDRVTDNVDHILAIDSKKNQYKFRCTNYVIAAGGIETARIMLNSLNHDNEFLANVKGKLGVGYMTHYAASIGSIISLNNISYGYGKFNNVYVRRRYRRVDSASGIGMIFRVHFPHIDDPNHGSSILSLLYLTRKLIGYDYGLRMGFLEKSKSILQHFLNIIYDPINITKMCFYLVYSRFIATRKIPPLMDPVSSAFSLDFHVEQSSCDENRIELQDDLDDLGIRKVKITWNFIEADLQRIEQYVNEILDQIESSGLFKCFVDRTSIIPEFVRYGSYGGHHIGTCRMGFDSDDSVVDKNLRVHGVNNLYILGSSTFPSSSQANPTLTIAAFAHRLAEYLNTNGLNNRENSNKFLPEVS